MAEYTHHIKVNLPDCEDSYASGNGEGCWALVDDATFAAYENDSEGGVYLALLDNDSWYYPGLMHGEIVPIELRGENRPVVPLSFLSTR